MNVIVLGSGVIGVTSAWYLSKAGYHVTVLDRQPSPAMETSFANGGQVSWSSATPWAAPDVPLKTLKWLFRPHSPLVLRPRVDLRMWSWMFQMLRNCTPARFEVNRARMVQLARYSYDCLFELRRQTEISYDHDTRGTLVLFRYLNDLHHAAKGADALAALGVPFQVLDRTACVMQQPALVASAEKIVGGMYFPGDETGDCRLFTERLAALVAANGVKFISGVSVREIRVTGDRVSSVVTDRGDMSADIYVAALGSYTPLLLRPHGINLPVYPVKGYSVTVPVMGESRAPVGTITDETYKVVVTRLGDRIRAAGTAELTGYDLSLRPSRYNTIAHVLHDLFPQAVDFSRAEYWCGLRPMTPDNPPVIGSTNVRNLFLNTGHGTLGWTMACGSGRLLADVISGSPTEIDASPYGLNRFHQ